eukprot:9531864-Ditylum_brightwellii.AAC.1
MQHSHRTTAKRSLQSFKEIEELAKENVTVDNTGEIPMEIEGAAKIKVSHCSNEVIPPPLTIFCTMYYDIGYSGSTEAGGIQYILILVHRKFCYCWVNCLKGVLDDDIKASFCTFK